MRKAALLLFLLVCLFTGWAFFMEKEVRTPAQLGERLFMENILSKDSSVSCSSCHKPQFGFADTTAFSKGIYGIPTDRNTPSVLNMKNRPYFFWDGRAATLEEQCLIPLANPNEMGLPVDQAVQRLNEHPVYKKLFLRIFKQAPNAHNLARAFAAYEKTLETGSSKFDRSVDDLIQLTAEEERGRKLFISDRTHCFDCHNGEDFTNDDFRNIGLYDDDELKDKGRFNITKDSSDMGKFKVPGLRNIALTAPYMHNGKFATLEEVVEYYNNPAAFIISPVNIDPLLSVPLGLTKQEKADLVAFLKTLTDKRYEKTSLNK